MTVDPLRKIKDVRTINKMLWENPRDHLLFVLGVNNGLRVGDLLKLTVGDLRKLKPGDTFKIKEGKTGKTNILAINKTVYKALQHYLEVLSPDDDQYLFRSNKGNNHPITIQRVNQLIKKWTSSINLKGNYGAHSLRKTWGYLQRKKFGVGFEVICKRFNHSNPTVTMRYLGIEDKEVNGILLNNEIC